MSGNRFYLIYNPEFSFDSLIYTWRMAPLPIEPYIFSVANAEARLKDNLLELSSKFR